MIIHPSPKAETTGHFLFSHILDREKSLDFRTGYDFGIPKFIPRGRYSCWIPDFWILFFVVALLFVVGIALQLLLLLQLYLPTWPGNKAKAAKAAEEAPLLRRNRMANEEEQRRRTQRAASSQT